MPTKSHYTGGSKSSTYGFSSMVFRHCSMRFSSPGDGGGTSTNPVEEEEEGGEGCESICSVLCVAMCTLLLFVKWVGCGVRRLLLVVGIESGKGDGGMDKGEVGRGLKLDMLMGKLIGRGMSTGVLGVDVAGEDE